MHCKVLLKIAKRSYNFCEEVRTQVHRRDGCISGRFLTVLPVKNCYKFTYTVSNYSLKNPIFK